MHLFGVVFAQIANFTLAFLSKVQVKDHEPKKILVIDDEFSVRYLVEHQLNQNDFKVYSAKDGPSGFKMANLHQPDLIVLDVMMPGMDGFQVCQKIRNTPETASIPVVFLTACMTKKDKMQAFKVGGDDYLVKPFEPDELLAHISTRAKVFR